MSFFSKSLSYNEYEFRPICRTVSDAAYVLDAIVGFDPRDSEATRAASKFVPLGGYTQFLNGDGLKGKRLGLLKNHLLELSNISSRSLVFEDHLQTLRYVYLAFNICLTEASAE